MMRSVGLSLFNTAGGERWETKLDNLTTSPISINKKPGKKQASYTGASHAQMLYSLYIKLFKQVKDRIGEKVSRSPKPLQLECSV